MERDAHACRVPGPLPRRAVPGTFGDRHDQVLRALDQLAGLGLVACVSLPNETGEYVSGYRTLREDELSRDDDLERLGAPA